jgi:glucose/arabinose dehydrogenase
MMKRMMGWTGRSPSVRIVCLIGLLLLIPGWAVLGQEGARPEGVPDPAGYQWKVVAEDFDSPLDLVNAGDGSGRLFVVEQGGLVWIIYPDGEVSFEPFLDVSALIPPSVFSGAYTEQGLLSIAFHPDYETNGRVFISYINRAGDTIIGRMQVMAGNPDMLDPASLTQVMEIRQTYADHNGGNIVFGPDGMLYVGMGDGGSLQDPLRMGQRTSTHLGKLLRLDVNADPYAVPPDNPFVGKEGYKPEIWALGTRNPWRFSFDRLTGDLYIGDVGQEQREEINFQPAGIGGQNYGWSAFEGTLPLYADQEVPVDPGAITMPVIEYDHLQGCSVTGGYVYRGEALPEMRGVYLFGDYCNGRVWATVRAETTPWPHALWMETGRVISSFGQDEAGEVYLVDYKGVILKLEAAG